MAFAAPGMSLAEIVAAVGRSTGLDTTNEVTQIYEAITLAGQTACTYDGRWWWFLRASGYFATANIAITKVARATNVTTITTGAAHNIVAGCRIYISGVTLAGFDTEDSVVVAAASTTTFTYANTGSDVTEVADTTGTVVGRGYPLRVVNSASMVDIYTPHHVWESTRRMGLMEWKRYLGHYRTMTVGTTGQPGAYALADDLSMYFDYMPDDEYTIYVDYLKRHSKITASSAATDLIIPAEFHRGIYVDGAVEMLKSDDIDGSVLLNSQRFERTMMRMQAAEPEGYDQTWGGNTLGGNGGSLPAGSSVIILNDI
ncbi:MAG TPA: hypothetical protein VNA25_07880 [Phycisphaerae bacterium]|nr:hypothetical protein [Phycisphaerae bacterium]